MCDSPSEAKKEKGSLTNSSDRLSRHKSEEQQWDKDSVGLGCHVPAPHKHHSDMMQMVQNNWTSSSAEKKNWMICSALNSSALLIAGATRGSKGERAGLRINIQPGTFLSSLLSETSKVTRYQWKSHTWFYPTAPRKHEATHDKAERRSGNVKHMSW